MASTPGQLLELLPDGVVMPDVVEAESVGKSMIRPLLSLERLSFLEPEGKVGYRYGKAARETETMDGLEFIARVTSHIPNNFAASGHL